MSGHQRAQATHLLDTLDAAQSELGHWLTTGQHTTCGRCSRRVPAADAAGGPVRHQLAGVWCEPDDRL